MADDADNADMDGVDEDQQDQVKVNEIKKYDLTPEMEENIGDVFDTFDKEKGGKIERKVLGSVLRWLGFNPLDRELIKYGLEYDKAESGYFKIEDVKDIVQKKQKEPDTFHEFIEACNLLDNDADGKIPITELRWALT